MEATSTSLSGATTGSSNERLFRIAVAAAIVLALVVFARRWVHHAQLELVPVIVPEDANAQQIVAPGARAIADRMLRDVRETLQPPRRPRLAVLTFDDGPYPVETPALAAQLRALSVPAVFFLIGDDAVRQPAIAARLAAAPVEIENHTLRHLEMTELNPVTQRAEIQNGSAALRAVTGARTAYFRPPHGNYDADTLRAAQAAGQTVALWDVDPGDWRAIAPQTIAASVIAQARAPAVILLHDGRDATIDALPIIVAAYRRAGFDFVTLQDLRRRVPLDAINDPERVRM